ncbi:MAG TPA: serine hydrolase domain-containing protein [Actinophytocola sp.]|uniref:serine hydrolase domain-containing protein n=1 Tax=Actinophytocola sp. TaxID=1872138 RepID=UPI002E0978D1|nr:serine hydrolase domain-containing protein [Actinophytocola sp.]
MRGKTLGILVGALLAGACTATPATPQPAPSSSSSAAETALADYLDGLVERQEFRGAVQVRLGDRVLLNRGYDMADTATGVPNGPDTRFQIASLTKQFTALAVLRLQELGKLRTADPVCAHLPRCPPPWAPITIDQLLTHTSGLFSYTEPSDAKDRFLAKPGTHFTPEQLIGTFADRPLNFVPGSQWGYSNSGYAVLGYLIELTSGQDYGTFLRQQIFEPLKLNDTGYLANPQNGPPVATGYADWSTVATYEEPTAAFAAGGLYSTVNDLARWNDFLRTANPSIVARDTLAQLVRPRIAVTGTDHYGYGIFINGMIDDPIYVHNGGNPGFSAYNEIRPTSGLSITMLSNLETADPNVIGHTLARLAR